MEAESRKQTLDVSLYMWVGTNSGGARPENNTQEGKQNLIYVEQEKKVCVSVFSKNYYWIYKKAINIFW